MTSLWILAIAFLLALGAVRLYARRTALRNRQRVTDDMVRRIEQEGRVEHDEPLDLEEIAREERRFMEETWDEPEEF